jgi:copper transport protein
MRTGLKIPLRLLLTLGLGLGLLVPWAQPAAAHAVVESSSPTDGQRLTTAPSQVTLTFSEPVTADLGGLRVVNASAEQVDNGDVVGSGSSTLSVGLRSGLGDATYVASYRVVSADSHPIKGSIVFTVGTGATADVRSILSGGGGDEGFEFLGWASRFLAYAGGLTAAGLAFFLFFTHDGGPEAPRLARIVRGSAFVGAAGGLGTAAAQAGLATGRGWSGVFDLSVLHTVLTKNLDWSTAVLIGGLAVVLLSMEVDGSTGQRTLAFYGGLATVLSFVLSGHPTEAADRWLAILSDAVHASAAALWLGGLVGLLVVLIGRGRAVDDSGPGTRLDTVRGTAVVVSRFSTMAFVSVLALWVAGATLAWIELDSREALTGTTYGRLVLVKVGIVLAVAVAAAYNRLQLVPSILEEVGRAETTDVAEAPDEDDARSGLRLLRRLRISVAFEALAVVAVLGVTGVLVNTPPGRSAVVQAQVVDQTQPLVSSTDGTTVDLEVAPSKDGQRAIHISYFDGNGRPFEVLGPVTVELSLPAQQIGPITRDVPRAGPAHFSLESIQISPAGTWQIDVVTKLGDFEQQRNTFTVPIN